jgi:tRNA(Arg) A34 adenosine deaminase TadA
MDETSFMSEALSTAKTALDSDEVPVGCVIVDPITNTILAKGYNKVDAYVPTT